MEAIIKFIAINSDTKESIDYICNPEKITISSVFNAISYATNKNKAKIADTWTFQN